MKSEHVAQGDHIYVLQSYRGIPFQHHGIDMGDGTVVHLAPDRGSRMGLGSESVRFSVRREPIDEFALGKRVYLVRHERTLAPHAIAAAAEARVGEGSYNLIDNNCEHFATECATGERSSRQVEFSHSTAVALTSAATKGIWALGGKLASRYAIKVAAHPHPLSLLADGVEAVATATGCAIGLSAEKTRYLARRGGELTAVAVGCAVAGPAGGALSLAMHRSSTMVAERVCVTIRECMLLVSDRKKDSD